MEELKQLRNIKKRAVMEKLKRIRKSAADDQIALPTNELDTDFDPAKHDQMMQVSRI